MTTYTNPIAGIQDAKHGDELAIHPYGLRRILERGLTVEGIYQALDCQEAEMVGHWPMVGRPSAHCLIFGVDDSGKDLHILVAYPESGLIITAYEPTLPKWVNPRERVKP